jgi:hypothetical protein
MTTKAAAPITSYAQLQAYMNAMIAKYGTSMSGAPHKAFWNTCTYKQFTTGSVPGVKPPVQILAIGDGNGSNLVQALQGVGLFGPDGNFPQMPADGSGPWTTADIQPLIDWINAKCPNA